MIPFAVLFILFLSIIFAEAYTSEKKNIARMSLASDTQYSSIVEWFLVGELLIIILIGIILLWLYKERQYYKTQYETLAKALK